jgi:hypothetical protein
VFESGSSIAALEVNEAVHRDLGDLAALALLVLGVTPRRGADTGMRGILDWIAVTGERPQLGFASELETRLFDLAEPLPISFERSGLVAAGLPARLMPARANVVIDEVPLDSGIGNTSPSPMSASKWGPLSGLIGDAVLTNPLQAVRQRVLALARGVRTPVWVVAGAVATALTLAIALVPQGEVSHATAIHAPPAAAIHAATIPTPLALPDDPVSALKLLLPFRAACIRDRSVVCLDGVDEKSSAASTGDAAIVQSIEAGGEVPPGSAVVASKPGLIERLGDSALISLGTKSTPASALMIKVEAGWRIRSFLSGKPVKK